MDKKIFARILWFQPSHPLVSILEEGQPESDVLNGLSCRGNRVFPVGREKRNFDRFSFCYMKDNKKLNNYEKWFK